MAKDSVEIELAVAPEVAWATVGDFGGIRDFLTVIESLRLEGDDRVITMFGMEVRERLIARDEDARTITYSVVDGVPLESHSATLGVTGDGASSKVTWSFEVLPDEMAPIFTDTYKNGLSALKEHLES